MIKKIRRFPSNSPPWQDEDNRRLKGLDEMPLPRRTMRQHYFRAKSKILSFLNYRPVRDSIRLVAFVVLALLIAKTQGWPVENGLGNCRTSCARP